MLELSVGQYGWSQPLFSGKEVYKGENLLQMTSHKICLGRATPFIQIDWCPSPSPRSSPGTSTLHLDHGKGLPNYPSGSTFCLNSFLPALLMAELEEFTPLQGRRLVTNFVALTLVLGKTSCVSPPPSRWKNKVWLLLEPLCWSQVIE